MAVIDLLKRADLFHDLTDEELDLVSAISIGVECGIGDVIFDQGSASDDLYLILNGEVDIQVFPEMSADRPDSGRITITTLRRGQSFGEMALITEGIRAATARCAQHDSSLIKFPRRELMQLFDQYPRLGYKIMHNLAADLAKKMHSTDLLIQERVTWSEIR